MSYDYGQHGEVCIGLYSAPIINVLLPIIQPLTKDDWEDLWDRLEPTIFHFRDSDIENGVRSRIYYALNLHFEATELVENLDLRYED